MAEEQIGVPGHGGPGEGGQIPHPIEEGISSGTEYLYEGTGGITFAGSGSGFTGYIPQVPTGGITFSGEGLERIGYVLTPSGGITFAGTVTFQRTLMAPIPTGGLLFSGHAPFSIEHVPPDTDSGNMMLYYYLANHS